MHFLYALVNFLLLGLGLWLVGRKSVLARFAQRREDIGKALDEAEALEAAAEQPDTEEITEPDTLPDQPVDGGLEALCRELEEEKALAAELHARELEELRREAMGAARDQAVRALCLELGTHLAQEPQVSRIRALEPVLANRILEKIRMNSETPGDYALLRLSETRNVYLLRLYVGE